MAIFGELSAFNAGAWVELYEIDLTKFGQPIFRFHNGVNEKYEPVVWQGNTYQPFPAQVSGFEISGTQFARPRIVVANHTGIISAALRSYNQMLGCKFTRKRTMIQYLDSINFVKTNYLLWSEDATKSAWTKTRLTASVQGVSVSTGSQFTSLVEDTTASNTHLTQQTISGLESSTTYRMSVICKALGVGANRQLRLRMGEVGTGVIVDNVIDLATGNQTSGATPYRLVENLGNNEYRVSVYFTTSASVTSITFGLWLINAGSTTYTGDGVSGALVTQMQLSKGQQQQTYQKTGATHNPAEDTTQYLPPDVFYIAQKTKEDKYTVEFELASAVDLQGVMIPKRQVISNLCPFKYRGEECGYTGGPVADVGDKPTTSTTLDDCSRTVTGCKFRFGEHGELAFGGFVGSSLVKVS